MEPQEIREKAFAFVEAQDEAGYNAFMETLTAEELDGFNQEMMAIRQMILSSFIVSGEGE